MKKKEQITKLKHLKTSLNKLSIKLIEIWQKQETFFHKFN